MAGEKSAEHEAEAHGTAHRVDVPTATGRAVPEDFAAVPGAGSLHRASGATGGMQPPR